MCRLRLAVLVWSIQPVVSSLSAAADCRHAERNPHALALYRQTSTSTCLHIYPCLCVPTAETPESLKVLRYNDGQSFDVHYDYFRDGTDSPRLGPRAASLILFLSDVHGGGEVVFPKSKVRHLGWNLGLPLPLNMYLCLRDA